MSDIQERLRQARERQQQAVRAEAAADLAAEAGDDWDDEALDYSHDDDLSDAGQAETDDEFEPERDWSPDAGQAEEDESGLDSDQDDNPVDTGEHDDTGDEPDASGQDGQDEATDIDVTIPKGYVPVRDYRREVRQRRGLEKKVGKLSALEQENQRLRQLYQQRTGEEAPEFSGDPQPLNYEGLDDFDPDAVKGNFSTLEDRIRRLEQSGQGFSSPDAAPQDYFHSDQEVEFFQFADQHPDDHPIHEVADWLWSAAPRAGKPGDQEAARRFAEAQRLESELGNNPQYQFLDKTSLLTEVVRRVKQGTSQASRRTTEPSNHSSTLAHATRQAGGQSPARPAPRKRTPRSLSNQAGVSGQGAVQGGSHQARMAGMTPKQRMQYIKGLSEDDKRELWAETRH